MRNRRWGGTIRSAHRWADTVGSPVAAVTALRHVLAGATHARRCAIQRLPTRPAILVTAQTQGVQVSDPSNSTATTPGLGTVFGPSPETDPPELVQLLTPEGERREHPDFSFDLDDEAIKGFYRDLVLARRVDTEATALCRQGELGIWASLLGQEAAQVGSGRAAAPQDFVFPTYRRP